jgi:hypothetical protein
LLHDLCRGVSEPQLSFKGASAAFLLRFVLMSQTRHFYVQIEAKFS